MIIRISNRLISISNLMKPSASKQSETKKGFITLRNYSQNGMNSNAESISMTAKKATKKRNSSGHHQGSILKWDIKTESNETGRPTREIGKVIAYSTAEQYDLRNLPQRLNLAGYSSSTPMFNVLGEAIWFPHWPPSTSTCQNLSPISPPLDKPNGEIFVFESGSFVSWGINQEQAKNFLDVIIRPTEKKEMTNKKGGLEINSSEVPEKETIDYLESTTGGPMFEVNADQIIINQSELNLSNHLTTTNNNHIHQKPRKLFINPFMSTSHNQLNHSNTTADIKPPVDLLLLSKLAVSSALARACRLSHFEAQLDRFLSKVEHVPSKLKSGNDSPLNKKEIISRYGELLELRQGLSLKEENLIDLPEWFWEDTGAEERHFKKILKEFDFERRLRVLNDKLSMAIELQGRLFEFSNSKYSHRLEWIIILLIAFEIAHAIYAAEHSN